MQTTNQPITTKWFPQFKTGQIWMFSQPVRKEYGFTSIEECETYISEIEELSKEEGIEMVEFRIVEAEV